MQILLETKITIFFHQEKFHNNFAAAMFTLIQCNFNCILYVIKDAIKLQKCYASIYNM